MDERLQRTLDSIVLECLGGPRGDPDSSHCRAAALAIALLESYGSNSIHGDELDAGYLEWAREKVKNEAE